MNVMVKHRVSFAQCLVYVEPTLPNSTLEDTINKTHMELKLYLSTEIFS